MNRKLIINKERREHKFMQLGDYPISENTRKAYDQGWSRWEAYCQECDIGTFPALPEDVAAFLADAAQVLSSGTLRLFLSAINKIHTENGQIPPGDDFRVKNTMCLLVRSDRRRIRRVKALLNSDLRAILKFCPPTIIGIRDAAVLTIGFAAALRRSEICALKFEDVEFLSSENDRMFLCIQRSKTDQVGLGYKIAVVNGSKIRPISRLRRWLRAGRIRDGYLFRAVGKGGNLKETPLCHSDTARLVKHYVRKINLPARDYAGHSLRSGFITSAVIHQARLDKIMEVSRHKNADTVMCYVRDVNAFQSHAGENFL